MVRQLPATLVALVFSAALFGSAAASASSNAAHYRAEPAAAPGAERVVVRDVLWRCGANGCVAGQSNSRAEIECAALVRRVGALRSFSVAGRPLPAEALEKCNARAR